MKKHLFLIGGTMGIGKTTVSQLLKRRLEHAVFLDGDWCWDADPFIVTDETKEMVLDNITHLLQGFLRCSAYQNVIFCWVMHEQSIIDDILSRLDLTECTVHAISLISTEAALESRLRKDIDAGIRKEDILSRSIPRLPLYMRLNTAKIDVSDLSPQAVADRISELIF